MHALPTVVLFYYFCSHRWVLKCLDIKETINRHIQVHLFTLLLEFWFFKFYYNYLYHDINDNDTNENVVSDNNYTKDILISTKFEDWKNIWGQVGLIIDSLVNMDL